MEILEFTIADYNEVLSLWQSSEGIGLGESDTREGWWERDDLWMMTREVSGTEGPGGGRSQRGCSC